MIKRIVLENFMSHGNTVLDLAEGLTVLVGPNNCGKSAVVEALRTLCENDNADHLLKHGEKQCAVTVETDDGHVISWKRKSSGTVWYEFDGEPQHRLKGKIPDKLHELLRLGRVETPHGDSIDVHFGRQKAPIFLLEEESADRKAAAFFSSTSDAEKLLEMQQLHRRKRANAKSMEKELTGELARADRTLESLKPLEIVEPKLVVAEELHRVIQEESKAIRELENKLDQMERVGSWQRHEAAKADTLRGVQALPDQHDTAKLERHVARIEQEEGSAARAEAQSGALSSLSTPPTVEETGGLEKSIRELARVMNSCGRYHAESSSLRSLSSPPELKDMEGLVALGKKLRAASEEWSRWSRARECASALKDVPAIEEERPFRDVCDRLAAALSARRIAVDIAERSASLQAPPALDDPTALHAVIERWGAARKQVADLTVQCSGIAADLDAVEAEAKSWAMQNPTCPLCGGAVDAKKVLSPEHQHA